MVILICQYVMNINSITHIGCQWLHAAGKKLPGLTERSLAFRIGIEFPEEHGGILTSLAAHFILL